ncbi:hypothetical protein D3C85_1883830 [compost metagenome]
MVAGAILVRSVFMQKTVSIAPAAAIRWPVYDLVLEIGMLLARSPKTFLMVLVSFRSLS